jgi:hypothetical protein
MTEPLTDDDFRANPDPQRQLRMAAAGKLNVHQTRKIATDIMSRAERGRDEAARIEVGCSVTEAELKHKSQFHVAVTPAPTVVTGYRAPKRAWTLRIDGWHPALLNTLMKHWTAAHRAKKADREVICEALRSSFVVQAEEQRRVSLLIVWPKGKRRADPDAFWKSVNDALVAGGALKNDSPVWCELGTVEQCRGERLTTFITLEEV